MENEPKKSSISEISQQIVEEYKLNEKEEVIFLRAVIELGGTGEKEDWEETLKELDENPKIKEALKEFAKRTD